MTVCNSQGLSWVSQMIPLRLVPCIVAVGKVLELQPRSIPLLSGAWLLSCGTCKPFPPPQPCPAVSQCMQSPQGHSAIPWHTQSPPAPQAGSNGSDPCSIAMFCKTGDWKCKDYLKELLFIRATNLETANRAFLVFYSLSLMLYNRQIKHNHRVMVQKYITVLSKN